MKSAFPFKDPQSDYLHRNVVARIRSLDYHFQLPDLNEKSWTTIRNNSLERERLEFVGDALIGAFIAQELYRLRPEGGPGYYTIAKSILTANSTFAHLMHKVGLHDMDHPVKPAGDAFETILAALHREQGVEAFQSYIRQYFLPLIETVGLAYDAFRIDKRKLKRMTLRAIPRKQCKHIKKGKCSTKANSFRTTTNSGIPKRTEPQQCSSTSIQAPVVIIDLTEDSDNERKSSSNSKVKEFRFSVSSNKTRLFRTSNKARDLTDVFEYPDQASVAKNLPAVNSCNESRDLLLSISTSSTVVSARKHSKGELKTLGECASGEDARFKASLGTIHNPIPID